MKLGPLLVVAVIATALVTGYHSSAADPGTAPGAGPAVQRVASAPAVAGRAAVSGPPSISEVVGPAASRLVAPAVRGIAEGTERRLDALQPSIARMPDGERRRAESLVRQSRALDVEAATRLDSGHAVGAVRSVLKSRSLMNEVRSRAREVLSQ